MNLFDPATLSALLDELGVSARRRLLALCRDLVRHYPEAIRRHRLPVSYFRVLADRLDPSAWSGWTVVGWVETLNDLLCVLDLERQFRRARDRQALGHRLFEAGEEAWYENRYFEDLFPGSNPRVAGLLGRLRRLCRRLAEDVRREALLLAPPSLCTWCAEAGPTPRRLVDRTALPFRPDFERAEPAWSLGIGTEGGVVSAPVSLRLALRQSRRPAMLRVHPDGLDVVVGSRSWPLLLRRQGNWVWQWRWSPPVWIERPNRRFHAGLVLGPAIRYRKGEPVQVQPPPPALSARIKAALTVLEAGWPAGFQLVRTLTARIVPVRSAGVVSYSDRTRPGLSFINCFDRGNLELVDDLLHENSHHHLNLILRKHRLRTTDRHQEVFYSPWRRSLRSLHGLLHATFTFALGARLFERVAACLARPSARSRAWRRWLGIDARLRTQYRCLEEVAAVGHALEDLTGPATRAGWLTPAGLRLVAALQAEHAAVARRAARFRPVVLASPYGPALRRHERALTEARALYTPRLGRSGRITGGNRKREKA